jgi:NAD dependent epimerase/dehydratase family enzyme
MGERLLLEGCRVLPKKLEDAGFKFDHPKLEEAMRHALR